MDDMIGVIGIPTCSVENCDKKCWRGQYCEKHWKEKWPESYEYIQRGERQKILPLR